MQRSNRVRAWMIFVTVFIPGFVSAETPIEKVLRQYASLAAMELTYDYKVCLVALEYKRVIDSTVGKLYRFGRNYADSTSEAETIVSDRYYCKLDHDRKKATVYELALLQKKLGLKLADTGPGQLQVNDSFALKHGSLHVDSSQRYEYLVSWQVEGLPHTNFGLRLRKSDYAVTEFTMEETEYEAEKPTYLRRRSIYNIGHAVPTAMFNVSRFFTRTGSGIVLAPKYAEYKLKYLIN